MGTPSTKTSIPPSQPPVAPAPAPAPMPAPAPAAPAQPAVKPAPKPAAARPMAKPATAASTAIRPATRTGTPASRGPPKTPARTPPRAPGGGKKRLGRTFWALFIIGLILVGTGAALEASFYPEIVHATTASEFLSDSHAALSTNKAATIVQLASSFTVSGASVGVGSTIVVKDSVTGIKYNSTTDTTVLTFGSISSLPTAQRASQTALSNDLFGTVQGQLTWLSTGQTVVMTFTIVNAKLPSGVYQSLSYTTIDGAADATYNAINTGANGANAVAIGPQFLQPSPAPLYDYLFFFLMALGVIVLFLAVAEVWLLHRPIERWLMKQTKDPKHLTTMVMGFTALLGGFFMPFYPWPWVLLIAGAVMLVAWKFPQLSLLILVLFVAPEVAYQSGPLGFIFLFATIPILFASLLDFRFGVGAFLTLFLAPIGLSFTVPVFLAMIFSLYLGLAVAVAGGLMVTLFVTLGNLPVLGYLVGPGAIGTPSLIAGHASSQNPTLPLPYFTANNIGQAYGQMLNPNTQILALGGSGIGQIAIPLAEIGAWCLATWLITYALHEREKQSFENLFKYSMFSGAILAGVTGVALLSFSYTNWTDVFVLLLVPGMLTAAAGSLIIRDAFEAYFTSRLGGTAVGTRVAEMKGLTKITFEMVGGLHDVKADIKESMIIPLMRKDVTSRFKLEPPKGILLFGPPGCGKTMLMKALASELGVEMISIKCSDLMSKWYGESENRVAELLRTARERAPCILFMDEIDAVAKRRDMYTADDVTPRLLSILLSEMDGIDKSAGVIVVGSTNKPDLIDPAMMRPGRLDKIIYVPPPDFNERMEITHVHLVGRPVTNDVDLAEIAKKTERFSGADLANLVREAATIAVRREMMTGVSTPITMDDFRQVLPRIKPSISLRMISDYEVMKMDYERKMHQVQLMERKIVLRRDDDGGLTDIKQAIREYVELPLTRPELMESYKIKTGRGILLFGPPGCGKTHIMRAAANELNVPMQIVNGPELVSALAGQSEAAVRDVLYRARENAPSIVFFDEIDALASKDSMKTPEVSRAVSQFLTEMDGLRPKDKVIIIATTNRPQMLDPALLRPGRFDKIFYVPPPDLVARQDIFRIHLKGVPTEGAIDFGDLARRSDGYSGADIASVVDEAKLIALREQLVTENKDTGPGAGTPGMFTASATPEPAAKIEPTSKIVGVRMNNLLEAITRTKTSITPETLAWAQEFIKSYGTRT
ncbi:MAG: AAA family ATPase [Thermoplasmata archaeon]|nr:AAA family ATPase [Thermoplasmata archaeon]